MIEYTKIDDFTIQYDSQKGVFVVADRMGERLSDKSFKIASLAIQHANSIKGLINS